MKFQQQLKDIELKERKHFDEVEKMDRLIREAEGLASDAKDLANQTREKELYGFQPRPKLSAVKS